MIKIQIKKQDQITNQASFPTRAEADQWLAQHEGMKSFGEPARVVQQQVELSPAVLAEDGSVLQEAITEMQEVQLPGSYEVIIEDISAQIAQQAINAEALAFLAATDYLIIREMDSGVPCPVEIKAQRQAARERIIK